MPAKAGDHLVQDEQRRLLAAQRLHLHQEIAGAAADAARRLDAVGPRAGFARPHCRGRLQHHPSNLPRMGVKKRLQGADVAIVKQQGCCMVFLGNAAPELGRPNEPVIEREERVLPGHADVRTTRESTRHFGRSGGDVRAVLGEFHHVSTIDQPHQALGRLQFDYRSTCEIHTQIHATHSRTIDALISVP